MQGCIKKIHCGIQKTANKWEYHAEVFNFSSKYYSHNLESTKKIQANKEPYWKTGAGAT